jgi:ribonuclease G
MALQVRVMRDLVDDKTTRILVDCADVFDQLKKIMERYHQSITNLLVYYDGGKPLFQYYKVEEEVDKALQRRVNLDSGGSVVFDQTEAMTTVDVNTGGDIGHRDLEKAAFNTNMQASKVIARQIRLRNVGGIIVIDFIDMDDDSHRQKVLASLKKALLVDTVATFISEFTELGLVQVNRKRINKSLKELLSDNCPTCDGVGSIKSLNTISCEIWREISRTASAYDCQNIRIQASPEVTGYLATEERSVLTAIEKSIDCTIQLRDDELYSREQFDIIPV